jgi:hypothetical protein
MIRLPGLAGGGGMAPLIEVPRTMIIIIPCHKGIFIIKSMLVEVDCY